MHLARGPDRRATYPGGKLLKAYNNLEANKEDMKL
jgi:hypothetical protein